MADEKPLRVAVVGAELTAQTQIPGFMAYSETNVAAICDEDVSRAQNTAAQFGIHETYKDCREMLSETEPDLVSITVPPHRRHAVALAALEAGAHVMCEVPLALNAHQVSEMLDAARAAGCIHIANLAARYLPGYYYQQVLLEQGYVGDVQMLDATHFSSTMRTVEDWDWRSDESKGGGVIGSYSPRYIDAFIQSIGPVQAVTCTRDTFIKERYLPASLEKGRVTAEDAAWLSLEMAEGRRATVSLSAVMAGMYQRFAIYGIDGVLVLEDDRSLYGSQRRWRLSQIAVPMEYRPPVWDPADLLLGPFVRLVQLTVDAIRYGMGAAPSFADGLAVQRVLDAAQESAKEGRRVEIK